MSETKKTALDALSLLREHTIVVADTGDFAQLKQFNPEDATTNPTLILQAVKMTEYEEIVKKAIDAAKATGLTGDELVDESCVRLAVAFGCEILKLVPGYVSTEVDANLSFNKEASVARAHKIIKLYEEHGISKDRILIKMATTWEGCEAARELEAEGIRCNMTLLFTLAQAIAAAEAQATLISPFVGRILDWHKKATPTADFSGAADPGVVSVKAIYNYFKTFDYKTVVMGASFRTADEIMQLLGCDKLTISPKLLSELAALPVAAQEPALSVQAAKASGQFTEKLPMSEADFRWALNEDAMGTEKLAEGIRNFNKDLLALKALVAQRLA